jgi:glycosyltransferase involved in cell wall biosynthesis
VVPNGVDLDRFTPEESASGTDAEMLGRLGLRRPYLLHLGTMEPRKGVADLVAAFELLAKGQSDIDLVLAGGEGWKSQPILEAIGRARVSDRIHRLGYVGDEDVPGLLRQARAVVYPSLEEGFGLPALEALACGTPLVTTAGTAMAELAGDSALLVPPGQPSALATAVEAVLTRTDAACAKRREVGIGIAARYSWEACAQGHMAAYHLAVGC